VLFEDDEREQKHRIEKKKT